MKIDALGRHTSSQGHAPRPVCLVPPGELSYQDRFRTRALYPDSDHPLDSCSECLTDTAGSAHPTVPPNVSTRFASLPSRRVDSYIPYSQYRPYDLALPRV
eukprot:1184764-Prorocentrum_minimum.AAC.1